MKVKDLSLNCLRLIFFSLYESYVSYIYDSDFDLSNVFSSTSHIISSHIQTSDSHLSSTATNKTKPSTNNISITRVQRFTHPQLKLWLGQWRKHKPTEARTKEQSMMLTLEWTWGQTSWINLSSCSTRLTPQRAFWIQSIYTRPLVLGDPKCFDLTNQRKARG